MIYEHKESWWNAIDRIKLPIHPPELSGIQTAESSSSKAGGIGERNDEFSL
jgi:hypothetical protein